MKARFLAMVLCLAVPGATVFGQEAGPYIMSGSKALLFNFNGFNAGTFFANGIGGKMFVSDAVAIRAALQFATVSESIPYDIPDAAGNDGTESATMLGIAGGLEYHFTQTRISPYVGGEVRFSTTSTSAEAAEPSGTPQTTVDNSVDGVLGFNGGLTFGVAALAGVEFFIARGVSLGAEYQLGWQLTSLYDETEGGTTVVKQGSTSAFGFSSGGGLTVSVYF